MHNVSRLLLAECIITDTWDLGIQQQQQQLHNYLTMLEVKDKTLFAPHSGAMISRRKTFLQKPNHNTLEEDINKLNAATKTEPLQMLLEDKHEWQWEKAQEQAWQNNADNFTNPQVLRKVRLRISPTTAIWQKMGTSGLCIKSIERPWKTVCSDRERVLSSNLWMWKVPSVHLRCSIWGRIRPQAADRSLMQSVSRLSTQITAHEDTSAEIRHEPRMDAREVHVCSRLFIKKHR